MINTYKPITLITMMVISSACSTNESIDFERAVKEVSKSSPGIQYMMMKDEKVVAEVNEGFADLAPRRHVHSSTMFNANSVTKTLTALAIMKLVEEGRLRLEDPLSNYMSEMSLKWDVTVEQLLAHTSGLTNP